MSQGVRWQACRPCLQWCNTLGGSLSTPLTSSVNWDWTPVFSRTPRSSPSCSSRCWRTLSCTRAAWWSRPWSKTSSGASTPMLPSVPTVRENRWGSSNEKWSHFRISGPPNPLLWAWPSFGDRLPSNFKQDGCWLPQRFHQDWANDWGWEVGVDLRIIIKSRSFLPQVLLRGLPE